MKPQRFPNGNPLIPLSIETDDVIGDLVIEITPDNPQYAEWLPYLDTEWGLRTPNADSADPDARGPK